MRGLPAPHMPVSVNITCAPSPEALLTTTIHDFGARGRSYALVAEQFDLPPRHA